MSRIMELAMDFRNADAGEDAIHKMHNLQAEVTRMEAELDTIKQQAQIWKQEARTQASIVRECYQACTGSTGEPGDWNGAKPVRELAAKLAALEAYKRQAEVSIAAQSRAWEQERNVSDELAKEVAQLRAEKVEREKQEPVAQLHPNHFKPNPDGTEWCREVLLYSPTNEGDKLRGVNTRVKLYRSAGAKE
jgi:DNA repair exonuclease SbcCD ATPase subunit